MKRSPRFLVSFAGVLTVLLLGWGLFFRGNDVHPPMQTFATPSAELEFFLADKMDYRVTFSRILAGRRIKRAGEIAAADPACAARAALVIDSLNARLQRSAPG